MASVGQLLQEVKLDDGQVRLQGSTGSIEYQLNNEGDEVVSGRTTRWVAFALPVPLSVRLSVCLSVCLSEQRGGRGGEWSHDAMGGLCPPCASVCLSVCLSVCVSVCLSVCLPVCLSASVCLHRLSVYKRDRILSLTFV
jgi:hypothetical protein